VSLNWVADSRVVALNRAIGNIGPIPPQALDWLTVHDYGIGLPIRFPTRLQESDLTHADRVIALKEAEHRPYLAERFSGWEDRVEYWHIHDLDLASADEALS
jgi:protein-tyrosine phosphatase